MNVYDGMQIFLVLSTVIFLTPILGHWMANVLEGRAFLLAPILRPVETIIYINILS